MEKVNFEELIKKLEKDSIEHGDITGKYDGTYYLLSHHWDNLLGYCKRLNTCIIKGESYREITSFYRLIDQEYYFIDGILYGLVAGRVITDDELRILHYILMCTVYPTSDTLD